MSNNNLMKKNLTIMLLLLSAICKGQIITTIAGTGEASNTGDGGPAIVASIDYPTGGTFDKYGNYYCTLGNRGHGVRKVSTTGIITRIAGTGLSGFSGDGAMATNAQLKTAQTVAVDNDGNIFIADCLNNRIRKVTPSGIITTVAGTGLVGYNGDGAALSVNIESPNNLCFDNLGCLYFSDGGNFIRKITTSGQIVTVVGNGIPGFGGNGVPATSVPISPFGICFDKTNNLYFADNYSRIYKITPSGMLYYFAGTDIPGYSGDGGPATAANMVPTFIKMDKFGNMFVAEMNNARIRLINSAGKIYTIAGTGVRGYNGDDIPATAAQLRYPGGIALDSCGNLYIADSWDYRIRKVTFPHCNYLETADEPALPSHTFSIYPNPATATVTINAGVAIAHISICNAVGQQVLELHPTGGKKSVEANVQHLPAGIYVVMVNGLYAGKMVKGE
jgi:hypothetical protein